MAYYERLRDIREDKDITQEKVAKALGTTKQQISKYEKGQQQMTIERFIEFCKYYGVSADYILELDKGLS